MRYKLLLEKRITLRNPLMFLNYIGNNAILTQHPKIIMSIGGLKDSTQDPPLLPTPHLYLGEGATADGDFAPALPPRPAEGGVEDDANTAPLDGREGGQQTVHQLPVTGHHN